MQTLSRVAHYSPMRFSHSGNDDMFFYAADAIGGALRNLMCKSNCSHNAGEDTHVGQEERRKNLVCNLRRLCVEDNILVDAMTARVNISSHSLLAYASYLYTR